MKKSLNDLAVDIIKKRIKSANAVIQQNYKGTRPFRFEPPPERESLFRYLNMTPEQKLFAQRSFGEAYDVYEQKMEVLKKKFKAMEVL